MMRSSDGFLTVLILVTALLQVEEADEGRVSFFPQTVCILYPLLILLGRQECAQNIPVLGLPDCLLVVTGGQAKNRTTL